MAKGSTGDARRRNRRLVLQAIVDQVEISRAAIARATGLTKPTVSDLVTEFVDDGLVREIGVGPSAGGKPPRLVALDAGARQIACIDVSSGTPHGAILGLDGTVVSRRHVGRDVGTGDDVVDALSELAGRLVADATAPLLGVGVGTPGLVDAAGCVLEAANLDWHDVPLGSLLEEQLGRPVDVINDSKAAALAEYSALDEPPDNLVVVTVGTGIGAGIVIDGRVFSGDGSAAGEIGHVTVADNDVECHCGRRGCLETVAGAPAVARLTEELGDGDAALRVAGRHLGRALAALVGVLDVHRIVIASPTSDVDPLLVEAVGAEIDTRVLPRIAAEVSVGPSTLGPDRVLSGVGALVLHHHLGITWR